MKKIRTIDAPKHPNVKIAVRNFGPIVEGTVDLRPLTVFIGPSNTGKTYFATLLYTLRRCFAGFPLVPFPRKSAYPPLQYRSRVPTSWDPLYRLLRNNEEELREVLEKLQTIGLPLKLSDLPKSIHAEAEARLKEPEIFRGEFENCFDVDSVSNLRRSVLKHRSDMEISLEVNDENQRLWDFNMGVSNLSPTVDGWIKEDMLLFSGQALELDETADPEDYLQLIYGLNRGTGESYYLPATRSGIMQSHALIASSFLGLSNRAGIERLPEIPTFSTGTAEFLQQIVLNRRRPRRQPDREIFFPIADALESDVLAGQIKVNHSSGGYPEFFYRPKEMQEEIYLNQASSMVSELAPLVLFIRGVISPGDTLIIEEPESHLHPGAQPEVAVALARLVKAGVRVVVTTHSGSFLEEIGNLIREGELDEKLGKPYGESPVTLEKEEVGVWRFQPDGIVTEIEYNRVDGVDPEEYIDVASDLYNRSARLQNWLVQTEDDQQHE